MSGDPRERIVTEAFTVYRAKDECRCWGISRIGSLCIVPHKSWEQVVQLADAIKAADAEWREQNAARCPECKGRGWHMGDCHPRETCGVCDGTGRVAAKLAETEE